jgi:TPR repeat protein
MNPNDIFAMSHLQQDIARAKQGNTAAATRTGYRYFTGLAGKRDLDLARYYFTLGARGVADASPWIHFLNFQAASPRKNVLLRKPLPYGTVDKLSNMADQGDVIALTLLGRVKERGWHGAGKDIAAAKLAYRSVGTQFALAQTFLGEIYLRRGHIKYAERMFEQAAEKNETRATVDLALIDLRKHQAIAAKQLLKAAVVQNDCRAMYRLGLLYKRGIGKATPKPDLAKGLLQHAARMGYPRAVTLLQQESTLALGRRPGKRFDRTGRWLLPGTSFQRNG